MKILYFTFIENPFAPENAGVMRGQVINLLKTIGNKNNDLIIDWLAIISTKFCTPKESEISDLKKELKENNVELTIIKIPDDSTLKKWNFAKKQLKEHVLNNNPDIIHCRVYPASLIAIDVRATNNFIYKVIFDARGVYPEQILERSPNIIGKIRFKWWKHLEKKLLKKSDLTVGVTNAFISHFKKIYNKGNYKYIPCCFQPGQNSQDNSIELKKELGFLEKDKVIVYSGNLSAKYSSVDLLVEILNNLATFENNAKFLILTKSNTDKLTELLKTKKLFDRTKILNLKPHEVPQYLSLCNIGTLFREKSIVNEVAMPTKFAEYLSCGLSVIVSDSIKGIAEIVKKEQVGIVLENSNITKEQVEQLFNIDKDKCKQVAKTFTVDNVANCYIDEYKKLLND